MSVAQAIKNRRTIRGFKPDPVPLKIIEEIVDIARYSASNCNTQPWSLSVVSGDARLQLEKELIAQVTQGVTPSPVFQPGDANLKGIYKTRQYECAAKYYSTIFTSKLYR